MTEQLFGKDTVHCSDRISSLYNLANAYYNSSLIPQALTSYKERLILRRQLLGDIKHPSIAGNLNNIGAVTESFKTTIRHSSYISYNMALEMRKDMYGADADHPENRP